METVKVLFAIGDRTTGQSETGSFSIDLKTAQDFVNDDEMAYLAFRRAAKKNATNYYKCTSYGFWISDEECKKNNIPDAGISEEDFLNGFYARFAKSKCVTFVVMEHTVWEDGTDSSNCIRAFQTRDDAIEYIKEIVVEKSGIMESGIGSYMEIDEDQGKIHYEYTVQAIPFTR